jgi:hypothetical protein
MDGDYGNAELRPMAGALKVFFYTSFNVSASTNVLNWLININ